mmetsp:Transcript_34381/g.87919  ORF Transcript_34381/g.87919 Transcript_34381/m.87919 type:complete len:1120 (-) Transcript_34381:76-3435(-)
MAPRMLLLVALLAGLASHASAQWGSCGSSHPAVGFVGEINGRQHQMGGTLQVVDDCTAVISMWSFDGFAPAAYWWGVDSTSTDQATLRSGSRVSGEMPPAANGGATITVKLTDGNTWDDVQMLYLWCELFDANFGEIAIGTGPPGGMEDLMQPADLCDTPSFPNCVELLPGRFKLYWKLDNAIAADATSVTMMYEGVLPDSGLGYFAFGFADPNLPESNSATMVGSDVVVAGFLPGAGAGFALDYFMTSKSQCDYGAGISAGVCPDSGLGDSPAADNAQLVCAARTGEGLTRVVFTKPLAPGDNYDVPWTATSAGRAVYATGALSSASTVSQPVVLYHPPQPDGSSSRAPGPFRINLGVSSFACQSSAVIMEMASAMPAMTAPDTVPVVGSGVTMFNVDTGINPNYPNPPAWGLSYRMNGLETPVIVFKPGQELVFNVAAGPAHPLYITDDINGGASNPQETVFAGGASSHGTAGDPFELRWTPDASTPDVVYYQCYTHQKLGWRLVKEGSDEAMAAVAASGNAQLMSEMTVEAPAATVTEANPACAAGLLSVAGMPTQFECGLDISGVGKLVWTHDAAANSVTFGAEMPTTGWIGIGFNTPQSVSRMPGSVAVIGQASGVTAMDLNSKSQSDIVPNDEATASLSNSEYVTADGVSSMTFTVDLATTPLPINAEGGNNHWIWAWGGETFGYHAEHGRGLSAVLPSEIEVEVEEVDVPPAIPTTAPAEEEQEVNPLCVDGPQRLEGSETSYECLLEFQAGGRAGQGRLAWTHDADAGTVDFALALPAEGWISVGFQSAENANSMPGALAVIGTPSGVEGYSLTSRSIGAVVPHEATTASLSNTGYANRGSSALLTFTVDLSTTPLPIEPEGLTHFIWALSGSDTLNTHSWRSFGQATLSSGVAAALPAPVVIKNEAERTHGILMAIAWVLLLPLGAVVAKYIPVLGKKAYLTHLVLQVAGVVLTIASLAYILVSKGLPPSWLSTDGERFDHGRVGIAVMAFAIFNPINAAIRPHPGVSLKRRAWEIVHLVVGKTALYLGAFNVFFGIYVYTVLNENDGGNWAPWIGLCVFAISAIHIGSGIVDKLLRHKADMAKEQQVGNKAERVRPSEDNQLASGASSP